MGRTTVLKTIQRLEGKGLLVRVKNSSPVQFQAVVNESRMLPNTFEAITWDGRWRQGRFFVGYVVGSGTGFTGSMPRVSMAIASGVRVCFGSTADSTVGWLRR